MTNTERNEQASELNNLGQINEAIEIWRSLLDDDDFTQAPLRKVKLLNDLGLAYNHLEDYPVALELFVKALEIIEEVGHVQMTGVVTKNIGMIYMTHGDYPRALEQYRKALPFHIEAGDKVNQANTKMSIADLLRMLGDVSGALSYSLEANQLFAEVNHTPLVASTSMFIAYYLHLQGDDAAAELWITRAVEMLPSISSLYDKVNCIRMICVIRTDQERHDEVLALIEDNWSEIEHFPTEASNTLILKAQILKKRGDLSEARSIFASILERAIEKHDMYYMINGHESLRDIAKTLGDFESYIKHNEEYQRLSKEFQGSETARKIAVQEKENEMLHERNERERERAILYGTLPREIADRMVRGESVTGDHFENAAVLFADIVGFTSHTSTLDPAFVVNLLGTIFRSFDEFCTQHHVLKVKTIGDSYMCFKADATATENAHALASVANAMQNNTFMWPNNTPMQFRIGIHIGAATAGVIGTDRLQYDVWGDTVNVASRMESTCDPGKVHVTEQFAKALSDEKRQEATRGDERLEHGTWNVEPRGTLEIKGKGLMHTYWLVAN